MADLTIELAKVVDAETSGPYKDADFSREDLRELLDRPEVRAAYLEGGRREAAGA